MCVLSTKRGFQLQISFKTTTILTKTTIYGIIKWGFNNKLSVFIRKNAAAQLTTISTNTVIYGIIKGEI